MAHGSLLSRNIARFAIVYVTFAHTFVYVHALAEGDLSFLICKRGFLILKQDKEQRERSARPGFRSVALNSACRYAWRECVIGVSLFSYISFSQLYLPAIRE